MTGLNDLRSRILVVFDGYQSTLAPHTEYLQIENLGKTGKILTSVYRVVLRSTVTNHMFMPGVWRMSVVAPNSEVHEILI